MKNNTLYYYYLELQKLRHNVTTKRETLDRFERRREMAKHSRLNSEGFVNRLTEGEDTVIEELQKARERKKIFDTFTGNDWENCAIILEDYVLPILIWCLTEFEYKPYTITIDNRKGYLYVFHSPEDAVGAKLRWS